ncbi:MAG: L-seryl-tRNA(Sec) selenium transferase [Nitrospirae bacterium]|nr:L-seryl-tRNA(Sec) selenium transferase [Nitrospirota bacterium]
MISELLRKLPSVDELLKSPPSSKWLSEYPRHFVLKAIRAVLQQYREMILNGKLQDLEKQHLLTEIEKQIKLISGKSLKPLINATGVVIHTNLGRAPLAEEALQNIIAVSKGYSNLEFNLSTGKRGKRYDHISGILRDITGAEDALVVNNNASAVLLSLSALARGKEVIVSRGELVEIGGSFRIPDVMLQSGAILKEVGTTNKTHPQDYEQAISESTALLLKVHQSNYRIIGFTEDVAIERLVNIAHKAGLPLMYDLGSGCFIDLRPLGITEEPVVAEVVRKGVDIVTFSGDKLLGGPQAGIILGKRELIKQISRHPLTRAVRIDKLTLSALEATLHLYLDTERAKEAIPVLSMLFQDIKRIKNRAQRLARLLRKEFQDITVNVVADNSQAGGGSLPEISLPTYVVSVEKKDMPPDKLKKALRGSNPPVIVRIRDDQVVLDMRTVQDREIPLIIKSFKDIFSSA